jgi:hypothetical protein
MTKRVSVLLACMLIASAAVRGEDAPALPNPLRNVRAGQWARYRVNTLFGTAEQRQTVVAVSGNGDEAVITIRTEMSLDGEIVDEREEAATYAKLLAEQAAALDGTENQSVSEREIPVAGASIPAVAVRYTQDGEEYTLFLSEDIPLAGVIRLVREGSGEPVVELIDYGE